MKPEEQRLVPKRPQVYGDLREITNTKAHTSTNMDGGSYPNNRTH